MAQVSVSSRGLLWINGWDRKTSFKRLRKRQLGMSKETDNDQVQTILKVKKNFILKGVIHSKKLCKSRLDFIVDLNMIQAYMKLYVMQGWRVGIRDSVSRD